MLLSKKTSIKVSLEYANLIGHMFYAASKLWNVCNYERQHYKETGIEQHPDWYYQKKAHKEDLWYKQLPSQTAQEVCKLLDKAWKSFYALKRSGGIETPRPPRFKQESIPITYMQMGIVHEQDTDRVRLSLPKTLKNIWKKHIRSMKTFFTLKIRFSGAWIRSNSCGSIRRRRETVKLLLFMRFLARKNFHRTDMNCPLIWDSIIL